MHVKLLSIYIMQILLNARSIYPYLTKLALALEKVCQLLPTVS